jgi:putative ABC transport system permease protein
MLKNHLIVAIRNALRHKTFTFINVIGLAIGLASSSLIWLYLQYEFSYDAHHTKSDRIHKVFTSRRQESGNLAYAYTTPGPTAPTLLETYPEIEDATRFTLRAGYVKVGDNQGVGGNVAVTDDRFFKVFDFPTIGGNPERDLRAPFSAYLTKSFASKLFGSDSAIGQSISIQSKYTDDVYTIRGILEDVPSASSTELVPDVLTWTPPAKDPRTMRQVWEAWQGFAMTRTYIVLRPGADPTFTKAKLRGFAQLVMGDTNIRNTGFEMMPLTSLHMYGRKRYDLPFTGDPDTCYALACISVVLIAVAAINFMNLATARSARRAQEVGMRKAVGAVRWQLIGQFLGESVLHALLAFALAIGLIALALPAYNGFLAIDLALQAETLLTLLIVCVGTGLLSGVYPACYLSSFSPASVFRSGHPASTGHLLTRKGLVVVQFMVATVLIVSTLIVVGQINFLRSVDPGFNQEALIVLRQSINDNASPLKTQLERIPGVRSVSLSSWNFVAAKRSTRESISLSASRSQIGAESVIIDADFLETFEIPLAAGRPFTTNEVAGSPNRSRLVFNTTGLMLNQTAASALDLQVGDRVGFKLPSQSEADLHRDSREVIGIVQDFHFLSLREPIGPLVLMPGVTEKQFSIAMRVDMTRIQDVLEDAKAIWSSFESHRPFAYAFADDARAAVYRDELRLSQLFSISATLAIAISALGLLGLVAYSIETRTREIAVRKVLGASTPHLTHLLTREFLNLVAIASLLAYPVAFYVMQHWLQKFAYRIPISPSYFVLGTIASLTVTLLTITGQSVRAARSNPVDALAHG